MCHKVDKNDVKAKWKEKQEEQYFDLNIDVNVDVKVDAKSATDTTDKETCSTKSSDESEKKEGHCGKSKEKEKETGCGKDKNKLTFGNGKNTSIDDMLKALGLKTTKEEKDEQDLKVKVKVAVNNNTDTAPSYGKKKIEDLTTADLKELFQEKFDKEGNGLTDNRNDILDFFDLYAGSDHEMSNEEAERMIRDMMEDARKKNINGQKASAYRVHVDTDVNLYYA